MHLINDPKLINYEKNNMKIFAVNMVKTKLKTNKTTNFQFICL